MGQHSLRSDGMDVNSCTDKDNARSDVVVVCGAVAKEHDW